MRKGFVVVAVLLAGIASAEFMAPVPAPVSRLIATVEKQLEQRSADPDLHYRRGRLYALLAVQKEAHIYGESDVDFRLLSRNSEVMNAEATDPVRIALKTSIAAYRASLKLRADDALTHLGLAWALEAGAKVKLPGAELKEARAEYKKAFELSQPQDGKLSQKPFSLQGLDGLVSYEAGNAYVRSSASGETDAAFLKSVQAHLAKLNGLPSSTKITPVIFSRSGKDSLAQLEDDQRCSTFDLDGTGRGACWSWLKPTAGILVWDPKSNGDVRNGWQLFGSVSFFLFLHHGYEALELLDDDGDGWLAGKELDGIAVWSDADRDGLPRREEVRSVQAEGIRRIAVRAVQGKNGVWQQPRGLELKDGSTRATWDWISTPRARQIAAGATP